jgi:pimeloyl-ACP methyl ester carboxylesterase
MLAGMAEIRESKVKVDGVEVFWRRAEPDASESPVLYLHGVPASSDDWVPFLERTGGLAPDLAGFGRSDKPASFDYSIPGYDRFVEALLDAAGVDRFSLVVHDWGAVGLATAQRVHERLDRLVVMNVVPFTPDYRWHRIARVWQRPVLGELAMGLSTRFALRRSLKEAFTSPGQPSDDFVDSIWRHFDHGTQRAILKLYRSAPPEVLAGAGRDLGKITGPALVLWGTDDPYLPIEFGAAMSEALGAGATLEPIEGAGHWPWLDRPDAIDRVTQFLSD